MTVSELNAILIKLSLRNEPPPRGAGREESDLKNKNRLTEASESDILIKPLQMGKPTRRGVGKTDAAATAVKNLGNFIVQKFSQ